MPSVFIELFDCAAREYVVVLNGSSNAAGIIYGTLHEHAIFLRAVWELLQALFIYYFGFIHWELIQLILASFKFGKKRRIYFGMENVHPNRSNTLNNVGLVCC